MVARFRARLEKACAAGSIDFDRHFRIVARRGYAEYLGGISEADLVLDSIHFSGGSTSLDVLSVGTPLVTLEGDRMRGRQTAGMLQMLGVADLIANDALGERDRIRTVSFVVRYISRRSAPLRIDPTSRYLYEIS